MIVQGGDTFTDVGSGNPHLWIVASDRQKSNDIVLVNVSSKQTRGEPDPLILGPQDCPWIVAPSFLRPEYSYVVELIVLLGRITSAHIRPQKALTPTALARVRSHLAKSPHAPNSVRQVLRAQGF